MERSPVLAQREFVLQITMGKIESFDNEVLKMLVDFICQYYII